jgi:hypothetical protein
MIIYSATFPQFYFQCLFLTIHLIILSSLNSWNSFWYIDDRQAFEVLVVIDRIIITTAITSWEPEDAEQFSYFNEDNNIRVSDTSLNSLSKTVDTTTLHRQILINIC